MSTQQTRLINLIEAAGLRVIEGGIAKQQEEGSEGKTLAQPSKPAQLRRFANSLWELIAMLDKSRIHWKGKMECAMERTVMDSENPGLPLFAYCKFSMANDEKKNKVIDVELTMNNRTVKAVVHVLFDGVGSALSYVPAEILTQQDGEGNEYSVVRYEPQWLLCMVLRPKLRGDAFRVVPVNLADPAIVQTWNSIASSYRERGASNEDWPHVEVMPNILRREKGRLFFYWKPTGLEKKNGRYFYGQILGKSIYHEGPESDIAQADAVGDEWKFVVEYDFLIINMNDMEVTVRCRGKRGTKEIRDVKLGVKEDVIDGFGALGVDPITADPDYLSFHAPWLAGSAPLDSSNPLYNYALGNGEVHPSDSEKSTRGLLRVLSRKAKEMVCDDLQTIREERVAKLNSLPQMPSLEEILAGKSLRDVCYRTGGEDVLASWIDDRIEAQFTWTSWLMRRIREDVLREVLRKTEIAFPSEKEEENVVASTIETAPVAPAIAETPNEAASEKSDAVDVKLEVVSTKAEEEDSKAETARKKKATAAAARKKKAEEATQSAAGQ